jgi:hypothetical protein
VRDAGVALIASGLSIGVVALVVLHLMPSGLSPLRNPVSQYGITRFKAGYRVQTLAYGLAGAGVAIGVAALPRPSQSVVVLCGVFAASRAAISWFPMDAPGGRRSATGRHHGQLAMCAFVALSLAALDLSRTVGHDHVGGAFGPVSGVLAAVMLGSLVTMAGGRRAGTGSFGLVERIFYLSMTAWLITVAALLAAT